MFGSALIAAVPYKIHTARTDNGIQFASPPRYTDGLTARYVTHMFDMRCRENGIEHRLTIGAERGRLEMTGRTIVPVAQYAARCIPNRLSVI